jgi:hypothetical protein
MSELLALPMEALDTLLANPAMAKAMKADDKTKQLVLDWEANKSARIAKAKAEAKTKKFTLGGQETTLAQLAMFLRANAYYVGENKDKSRKDIPVAVVALLDEAVAQLGILMPTDKLWNNLTDLAGIPRKQ